MKKPSNTRLSAENVTQNDIDLLLEKIQKYQSENEKLRNENAFLRRTLFGRSSERFVAEDPNQLKIGFDGEEQLEEEKAAQQVAEKEEITYTRTKSKDAKSIPVRQPLPDHLERVEEVIEPDPIPEGLVYMGSEVTEILEFTPAKIYVRRIVRKKYALPEKQGVIIAELPSLPLPNSNAGASLLAHILVSKYVDHLPFYRQIEIFKRENVHLSASRINGWFSAAVDLLEPLYDELRKQVLACDYIQLYEIPIPVMDKDKPGATKLGYHWIARSPELGMLFFHYDHGSRAQRVAIDLLKDFKGAVQSDGYSAYSIYENKANVLLLGCWAHARRKFEQALKNDPQRATFALNRIQEFYAIERQIVEQKLDQQQALTIRQEKAYPLLKDFEKWIVDQYNQVLPKSLIGVAMAYTYTIYPRLVRYVIDPRYRIDNNLAENGVRPLALGRKNYLFCGNHQAAKRAAIIYSLLGTCKLNNVNPTQWLTMVLSKILDHKANKLHELLPITQK